MVSIFSLLFTVYNNERVFRNNTMPCLVLSGITNLDDEDFPMDKVLYVNSTDEGYYSRVNDSQVQTKYFKLEVQNIGNGILKNLIIYDLNFIKEAKKK